MHEVLIRVRCPKCDQIAIQEFKEVAEEYFAANVMDGDTSRIEVSVVDVTGVYDLTSRQKKAEEDERYKLVFSQLSEGNKRSYEAAVAKRKKLEAQTEQITTNKELLDEVFEILSKL